MQDVFNLIVTFSMVDGGVTLHRHWLLDHSRQVLAVHRPRLVVAVHGLSRGDHLARLHLLLSSHKVRMTIIRLVIALTNVSYLLVLLVGHFNLDWSSRFLFPDAAEIDAEANPDTE